MAKKVKNMGYLILCPAADQITRVDANGMLLRPEAQFLHYPKNPIEMCPTPPPPHSDAAPEFDTGVGVGGGEDAARKLPVFSRAGVKTGVK